VNPSWLFKAVTITAYTCFNELEGAKGGNVIIILVSGNVICTVFTKEMVGRRSKSIIEIGRQLPGMKKRIKGIK
jgi:hypothetical protein